MAELSIFFDLMGSSISSLNNFTSTSRTYDNDGKTLSFVIQGAASAVDAANAFTSGIDSYDSAYKRMLGKLGGGLGLGVVAVKIYEDKDLNWGDYFTIGASVVSLIGRFTPVGMILNIGSAAYTLYDLAENGWLENDLHPSLDQAERTSSPIVIDLNGDGIHATKLAEGLDKAVHFDLDGNGFAEKTAWIDASDALLVLDKNANGRIDNGHELFGNHSLNAEGKKAFADGYAALAAYDENQDGRIDAQDAVYAQLAVWQDKNGNGISEAGEVLGLAEAGIAAIDLNAKAVNERDAAGNRISHRGSVEMADGSQRLAEDLWFQINPAQTRYVGEALSPEAQAALLGLPNVRATIPTALPKATDKMWFTIMTTPQATATPSSSATSAIKTSASAGAERI